MSICTKNSYYDTCLENLRESLDDTGVFVRVHLHCVD